MPILLMRTATVKDKDQPQATAMAAAKLKIRRARRQRKIKRRRRRLGRVGVWQLALSANRSLRQPGHGRPIGKEAGTARHRLVIDLVVGNRAAKRPVGLPLTLQNDSYVPTDASTFFSRGVPSLTAFTGSHGEYHTRAIRLTN